MAAPVPPPSQSPSKKNHGWNQQGWKNIPQNTRKLADFQDSVSKWFQTREDFKKTKLPPTSGISSFILAWCGPQFSNSLAIIVFSSSSNVSRVSAVALAVEPIIFSLPISFTKIGKYHKKHPNLYTWSTQINLPGVWKLICDSFFFWRGGGLSEMVHLKKKKAIPRYFPKNGNHSFRGWFRSILPFKLLWHPMVLVLLFFHFQASNKLFHKEMYIPTYPFFQS